VLLAALPLLQQRKLTCFAFGGPPLLSAPAARNAA
jgi:hypothetical protein